MRSIRGGSGLGDAIYVQAIARHLVRKGERLQVCSAWPDVFRPLGDSVEVVPFRRGGVDILAHYSLRKPIDGTTQFQDCCIQAGITEPVELRLDWQPSSVPIMRNGLPVVCVQLPRAPMNRRDGFGSELLPDCRVIQTLIDELSGRALIVLIGSGKPLFKFTGIDVDLSNSTTVPELFDMAHMADAFIGYPSFIIPLAEALDKPSLLVWSSRGLRAPQKYVRQITPRKVLHKPSSHHVVDDWPRERILGALGGLLL